MNQLDRDGFLTYEDGELVLHGDILETPKIIPRYSTGLEILSATRIASHSVWE